MPLAALSKFTHVDDYLILEDESGRVKLTGGAILALMYVTGMCSSLHLFALCSSFFIHVRQ